MASLIVQLTSSGESFELEDLDLERVSPESLIREMIYAGAIPPEDALPTKADGRHIKYGIVDKNNFRISLGDLYEYDDVDFDEVSPKEIIDDLIQSEILIPESELPPKRCDGSSGYYGVLNNHNEKINTNKLPCNKPLSAYGFEDGDTLRIYVVGCCG